jgi:AcrR family transcriptional regulator
VTASPKRRKTQAERSAETRAKLLAAAIECLHTQGYAASTTLLIAEKADISRGAMLHQFPTRVELMLYVVRSVFDQEIALYAEEMKALEGRNRKNFDVPLMAWNVLSRPEGVAVLEIMLGARSDPELADRLSELQSGIEKDSFVFGGQFEKLFGELASPVGIRLIHWAVRGLSIANLLTTNPKEVRDSLNLLTRVLDAYRKQEKAGAVKGRIAIKPLAQKSRPKMQTAVSRRRSR